MTTNIARAKYLIREALILLSDYPDIEVQPRSRLIRLPEVLEITGMKTSTLYKAIRDGQFPPPVKMGPRMSAWQETAIQAWVDSRPNSS